MRVHLYVGVCMFYLVLTCVRVRVCVHMCIHVKERECVCAYMCTCVAMARTRACDLIDHRALISKQKVHSPWVHL
jgi:hypothetical protein